MELSSKEQKMLSQNLSQSDLNVSVAENTNLSPSVSVTEGSPQAEASTILSSDTFFASQQELIQMLNSWKMEQDTILSKIMEDMRDLKDKCNETLKTNTEIEKPMDYLHNENIILKSKIKSLESLKREYQETNFNLEKELQEVKFGIRSSSIEIKNFPGKQQETTEILDNTVDPNVSVAENTNLSPNVSVTDGSPHSEASTILSSDTFFASQQELIQMLNSWKTEQDTILSKMMADMRDLKDKCNEILKTNAEIETPMNYIHNENKILKSKIESLESEKRAYQEININLEKELQGVQFGRRSSSKEIKNFPDRELSVGNCSMEEFLGKEYAMVSEENFEAYLQHLGFSYIKRKVAVNVRPVQCLTRNEDGTYKFTVKSTLFTWDIVFEPGVLFDGVKPDGEKMKTLITIEGNIMTHKQYDKQGITSVHVIEFTQEEAITTTTVEGTDIVAKRVYKLVK